MSARREGAGEGKGLNAEALGADGVQVRALGADADDLVAPGADGAHEGEEELAEGEIDVGDF